MNEVFKAKLISPMLVLIVPTKNYIFHKRMNTVYAHSPNTTTATILKMQSLKDWFHINGETIYKNERGNLKSLTRILLNQAISPAELSISPTMMAVRLSVSVVSPASSSTVPPSRFKSTPQRFVPLVSSIWAMCQ